jgi:ATP-dependent helicase Lhr and Lhr-like helicase
VEARDLARLDPGAIDRVAEQVRPQPRDADELHDLLMTLFALRPQPTWQPWFDELAGAGRAAEIGVPGNPLWCAAERQGVLQPLYPDLQLVTDSPQARAMDPETAAAEMLRGHLDVRGPSTAEDLARATALRPADVTLALIRLENEGFALRGRFTDPDGDEEFCARRVLTRIHAYTRQRKRHETEPVTAQDFIRFLLRWQHVTPDTRREGSRGVLAVVEQLQGFELAAGAWEKAIFPARVTGYRREWLDEACLDGGIAWGRLSVRPENDEVPRRGGLTPSRATPITMTIRDDLPWLLRAARGEHSPAEPGPGPVRDVLDALRERGALFPPDLALATRQLPTQIEEALWDGVARGLITADGFRAVRSLFARRTMQNAPGRHRLRRGSQLRSAAAGRWSLLPDAAPDCDPDELAEAVAEQLAARWGVVFYDLLTRENLAVPWREVLWALRRMEARGTVAGGRFVAGLSGEQFAHPDAVDMLREIRKRPRDGQTIELSAADPLNLAGIVLPGPRIPALATNTVSYTDGALTPAGLPPVLTA